MRDYKREARDSRRERGLCTSCGKRPEDPNYVKCEGCRCVSRERTVIRRAKLRAAGYCIDCGRERIAPGRACHCDRCAGQQLARSVAYNRRCGERAAGGATCSKA